MAAVVVGDVLLRGGEAGSVVPTKVPGNLEDGGHISAAGRRIPVGVPCAPQSAGWATATEARGPPTTYMAPWELAA